MGACSFDPYTTAVEAGQEWQGQWQGGRGGGGFGRGSARGRRGGGRGAYQGGYQQQQQGGGQLALAGGQPGASQGGGVQAGLVSSRPCLDYNRGACQYPNCKFTHKCNKVHSLNWNHPGFVDVSSLHSCRWCRLEEFVARATQRRTTSGLHGVWNGSCGPAVFTWKCL